MHDVLIISTALTIIFMGWRTLRTTRDPLAPMVVFSPMLLYMFAYYPLTRIHSSGLSLAFPNPGVLDIVFVVFLVGVISFCAGLTHRRVPRGAPDRRFQLLPYEVPRSVRRKLLRLSIVLGTISVAAFWFMVYYSGGWGRVFSAAKPFLKTPSGYIGELPMLSYPSVLLLAIAWQGRRMTLPRVMTFLLIASPHLIMATFGGRRGPMFLSVCVLGACWCIVNSRRPKLQTIILGGGALGLVLLLLGANRGDLFRPWENEVDFTVVTDRLGTSEQLTTGDEFVAGSAMIIASNELPRHYWGSRFLVMFLVRPIPSAIWPSKYHDTGFGWMRDMPGSSGIMDSEWLDLLGFIPASGNAGGFIPDMFLEFSWGMALACYLIGRVYNACWYRWRTRGGLWILLYFEMLILAVYLPSQSVGAWLYRWMLMAVPTLLVWKHVIARSRPRQRPTYRPAHSQHSQRSIQPVR